MVPAKHAKVVPGSSTEMHRRTHKKKRVYPPLHGLKTGLESASRLQHILFGALTEMKQASPLFELYELHYVIGIYSFKIWVSRISVDKWTASNV